MKTIVWILAACLMAAPSARAQSTFRVVIQFPAQLDPGKLQFSYDNGLSEIPVKPTFQANRVTLTGTYYSPYASVQIIYPNGTAGDQYYTRFFVKKAPARITFQPNATGSPFGKYALVNAQPEAALSDSAYQKFVAKESRELTAFLKELNGRMNDSLAVLTMAKVDRLSDRQIEFIKQNPKLYYSLWLFRKEVVYGRRQDLASSLQLFSLLSKDLRESAEGAEIQKVIRSLHLKKGVPMPDLATKDVYGKIASLADYRGKYVLINFWASWCGPCIAEMPAINRLRQTYPEDKLAMIFITQDHDSTAFARAVRKYVIRGRHLFSNDELIKFYGSPIPKVFVVDPNGMLIYSRDEEKDFDLKLLTERMSAALHP